MKKKTAVLATEDDLLVDLTEPLRNNVLKEESNQ
jgi:hypothetical protein